jgi:hypothetical protein
MVVPVERPAEIPLFAMRSQVWSPWQTLGPEQLLQLLHVVPAGQTVPRSLVEGPDRVYRWEGEPCPPPEPGDLYSHDEERKRRVAWATHRRYWPDLSRRVVRKLLTRGWAIQPGDRLTVTPAGTAVVRRIRDAARRDRESPWGARRRVPVLSHYRTRHRRSFWWQCPPGVAPHRWIRERFAEVEDLPDPAPRKEARRRGWGERAWTKRVRGALGGSDG